MKDGAVTGTAAPISEQTEDCEEAYEGSALEAMDLVRVIDQSLGTLWLRTLVSALNEREPK